MEETLPNRSSVVLFSQTFPFDRGEEFIEAELPHLLNIFDQVIVVPTRHTAGMSQTRSLPGGAILVSSEVPRFRQESLVAEFCVRHPLETLRSVVRAFKAGPRPSRVWSDFKFDLHAISVARSVASALAGALGESTSFIFYGFWLHTPTRVALEARRLLGLESAPVVSRANGFDLFVERNRNNYLPQRERLLSGIHKVFAASTSAEQYLHDRYPTHRDKFSTGRIGTSAAINPGNASQNAMHIVSCSYIAPVKRLPMLIDDIAEAQTVRGMPLTWTHIGPNTGEYSEKVMTYASRVLAPGSFQFMGHLGNRDLREWYANNPASAFVQVSESEGGLAASIQEALAQGLPVIVTDVGGVSVLRGATRIFDGLLSPEHTPTQFADRLEALVTSDNETYEGYVKASVEYWHANCSADKLASAFARRLYHIGGASAHINDVTG